MLLGWLATAELALLWPKAALPQHAAIHAHHDAAASTDGAAAEFAAAARTATQKYRDRDVAIASGFRQLGMDFPSMGEHWVNPGKVMAGKFDPADPAMLTYARIRGKVELVGVVYAVPLAPGADPPSLSGGVNRWHEHNGTVDEESMLPEHHSSSHSERSTTRLAILHLWLWVPNSAGIFAADNWGLPFARLGFEQPRNLGERTDAARAISLVSGGEQFYTALMRDADPYGQLSSSQSEAVKEAVSRVTVIVARLQSTGRISDADIGELEQTWRKLARGSGLLDSARPH
jgi:hypothetical protein